MLQITLPGLGPAYTPPCLGQDNPGSSTRYMPLIIKKVERGCGKVEEEEERRTGRRWGGGLRGHGGRGEGEESRGIFMFM